MLKNVSKLEIKVGERVYHFLCEADSPLGEAYDVLSRMRGFVLERMKDPEKPSGDDPKEG